MAHKYLYFQDRPKKLSAAYVKKQYAKLLAQLATAEASDSPNLWISLFGDWNALQAYISGEACRLGYAYSKDLSNKKLEAEEKYFRDKLSPVIDQPEYELAQSFMASQHRAAIAKRYGEQLVPIYETAMKPLDPINTPLAIKASALSTDYQKIIASAQIKVGDKMLNVTQVRALSFSPDRQLREQAYRASAAWFTKNRSKIAKIYDKQVKLRHQMGTNLGFDNYVPLAYKIRGRQDYNQADVKVFRDTVLRVLVPFYEKIAKHQAKSLGQSNLKPWDMAYNPNYSIPMGSVPVNKQLDNAQKVFDQLSSILGKHFKTMRQKKLIDLETRPNKQAGAYCTEFQDENLVAILLNSTGDPDDIRVLTHEMGHAFQMWESWPIESVDLQTGTYELAEVYSMGMEFLSLPYMTEFFSPENAKKFGDFKWIDTIYTICYVCVVDEFQHWVYKNPNATFDQRDQAWVKLQSKYLPFIDYSGLENFQHVRWYAQAHIFANPFYYIDYALAETCAMQLGVLANKDHKKTVQKYLAMCKLGGTMSFLNTLKSVDLESPFNPKLLQDLVKYADKIIFKS